MQEVREQTRVLHKILRVAQDIRNELRHNVTSATISRQGDSTMNPVIPGSTQSYAVTLGPDNATVIPADGVWSSSDSVNAPIVGDGLTATVTLSADIAVGATYDVEYMYTNADNTVVVAPIASEVVVAPVVDVTSAEITRTA